jgi:hypothetical protein
LGGLEAHPANIALFAGLSGAVSQQGPARERLRGALSGAAALLVVHRKVFARVWMDAAAGEPVALEFMRANMPRHIGLLLDLVQQAQAEAVLRPLPPFQCVAVLMGATAMPIVFASGLVGAALPATAARQFDREVMSPQAIAQRVDLALAALRRMKGNAMPSCRSALLAVAGLGAACSSREDVGWSGYVEGDYVYVAAPLGGSLETLAVRRGQAVTRGAPLFALSFAMAIGVPVLQLVLFGHAINTDPKGLPTALVSCDNGPMARGLVAALQNTGYFRVTRQSDSKPRGCSSRGRCTSWSRFRPTSAGAWSAARSRQSWWRLMPPTRRRPATRSLPWVRSPSRR